MSQLTVQEKLRQIYDKKKLISSNQNFPSDTKRSPPRERDQRKRETIIPFSVDEENDEMEQQKASDIVDDLLMRDQVDDPTSTSTFAAETENLPIKKKPSSRRKQQV